MPSLACTNEQIHNTQRPRSYVMATHNIHDTHNDDCTTISLHSDDNTIDSNRDNVVGIH